MKKSLLIKTALATLLLLSNAPGLLTLDEQDNLLFTKAIEKPQLSISQPSRFNAWFMGNANKSALDTYRSVQSIFSDIVGKLEASLFADLGQHIDPLTRAKLYTDNRRYPLASSLIQLEGLRHNLSDLLEALQKHMGAALDDKAEAAQEELKSCIRKLNARAILLINYFKQHRSFAEECYERGMSAEMALEQIRSLCKEMEVQS